MSNSNNVYDIGSIIQFKDGSKWKMIDKDNFSKKLTITIEEYISEENPFNEAEIALKNKEYKKAIKLFKEAIRKRDNIVKSLDYLIELKYDDIVELLVDSENFISEQDSNKFKKIIESKNNLSFKDIYFNKAVFFKENGEKEKAIEYYNKYIKENEKSSISIDIITDLISLYHNLKQFDDAIKLLDKITDNSINCKITDNFKNRSYFQLYVDKITNSKDNIDDSLEALLEKYYTELMYEIAYKSDESTFYNKINYSIKISNVFYNIGRFDKSINYLDKAYKYVESMNYSNLQEYSKNNLSNDIKVQLIDLSDKLMTYYYKINYNKSLKISQLLLKIDKNNQRAYQVRNKNLYPSIFFEKINNFIERRIKKQEKDNDEFLKKYKDKDCSEEELKKAIENTFYTKDRTSKIADFFTYKTFSNRNFAFAKIIRDKNNFKDTDFFKEHYYLSIAEGCCHYANARLHNIDEQKNVDEARYGYLQTILLYKKYKIKDDTSYHIALKQYIKSFFVKSEDLEKEDISSLYKNRNSNDRTKLSLNLVKDTLEEYIIKNINKDISYIDILKFTLGMIELLKNSDINEDDILGVIILSPYKNRIIDSLSEILDEKIENEKINELRDLKPYWRKSTNKFFKDKDIFFRLINKCLENIFEIGECEKCFCNLENSNSKYKQILEKIKNSNYEYMKDLSEILQIVRRYNDADNYYKIKNLSDINERLNKIFDSVEGHPTFFYYDTPWEKLRDIVKNKINEQTINLGANKAKLDVSAEYYSLENNIITVHIIFENRSKRDLDNVQIKSIKPSKYLGKIDDETLIKPFPFYFSSKRYNKIKFRFEIIDKKIWEDLEFSFDVKISYTYKDILNNVKKTKEEIFPLKIRLNDVKDFKKIKNSFNYYKSGQSVDDYNKFYGRDNDIKEIINQIIDDDGNICKGRALALYGQRRTGKTSLLYFLKLELRNKYKDNIIVDIGDIGDSDLSDLTSFLNRILNTLDMELKAHEELLPYNIQVNKEINNIEDFNSQFKSICNLVHNQNRQIILMIDEFTHIYDLIKQNKMTDQFMRFWKAFINNNGIFAIVIAQDHMMSIVNDLRFTNSLATTDIRKVTYLEKEYAKELMYKPIILDSYNSEIKSKFKYTDKALDYLYELTSGSAYLITQLCRKLIDYLNKIKNLNITKTLIDEYLDKYIITFDESIFHPQYEDLEPDSIEEQKKLAENNKNIIRKIVFASNEEGWAKIEDILSPDKEIAKKENELIGRLESRDVLIKKNGKYKIKVDFYRKWIITKEGRK